MSNPNAAEILAKREMAISAILGMTVLGDWEGAAKIFGEESAKQLEDFFRVNSVYRLNMIRFIAEAAHKAGVAEGKSQRRRKTKPETQEEEQDAAEPVAEPG